MTRVGDIAVARLTLLEALIDGSLRLLLNFDNRFI